MSDILGYISFVASLIFYLSPSLLLFQLISQKVKIQETSFFAISCALSNGILWSIIRYLTGDKNFDWCNLIGSILCFFYLIIYLYYYSKGNTIKYILYLFTLVDLIFECCFIEHDIIKQSDGGETLVKIIASIFNVLMYITPGFYIFRFFKSWNYRYIFLPMALVGNINSLLWLIYYIVDEGNERSLIISNSLGLIVCLFQTIFYFMNYNKNTPRIIDEEVDDEIKYKLTPGTQENKKENRNKSGTRNRKQNTSVKKDAFDDFI